MQTLWLIIRREVISNVLTSRFIIGFLVCLLATGVAVMVQVDDYEKRLTAYHTAVRASQGEARTWDTYSELNPKAHRKPNPLGIFHVGMETFGGNTVSVEPAAPIWRGPHGGFFAPIQKMGTDNPFLSIFLSVDVTFIFKIVLSALAILFAYNAISGEREDGTLKLVLSNAVPRDTIVLGKYLGGMCSLLPIVGVSLLFALLFAYASPATAFDSTDLGHIGLIFAVSLVYVSTWYLLGLLFSVWTKTAATTLILSMFVWVIVTTVHSNVATFAVERLFPSQATEESFRPVYQEALHVWEDFKKERNAYVKQRGQEQAADWEHPQDAISWASKELASETSHGSVTAPWYFKDTYQVRNIEHADLSVFQDILGYQEPLRIRYAEKVEAVLNRPSQAAAKHAQLAADISRLSFADVYSFAVGTLAGTGRESYTDFLSATRTYRRQLVAYLTDREAFSSRVWFSSDRGEAVLTDMPVFQHRRLSLSESLSRASGDILILVAWNIILFLAAYVSFLRADLG